jgi:hypothetical protein
MKLNQLHFGTIISLLSAFFTLVTFIIAINTPPLSGPFCIEGCYEYPYIDIAERFPRDYFWMYPAMIVSILYLMMMNAIHEQVQTQRKIYSRISLHFALMSTLLLVTDYFMQVSVIQPSLIKKELDGLSLLTQFNPHGIFIVLEELGFTFMSLSFLMLAPTLGKTRPEKIIRTTGIIGFLLVVGAWVLITLKFGIMREYRFEVAVITITWLQLIVISLMLMKHFYVTHKQNN